MQHIGSAYYYSALRNRCENKMHLQESELLHASVFLLCTDLSFWNALGNLLMIGEGKQL